jgi:hypothetical protein
MATQPVWEDYLSYIFFLMILLIIDITNLCMYRYRTIPNSVCLIIRIQCVSWPGFKMTFDDLDPEGKEFQPRFVGMIHQAKTDEKP